MTSYRSSRGTSKKSDETINYTIIKKVFEDAKIPEIKSPKNCSGAFGFVPHLLKKSLNPWKILPKTIMFISP